MSTISDVKSGERLIPVIRAKLAERLAHQGFRVKDIAEALREYQTNGNLRPTLDLMLKEYRRLKAVLKR